MHIVFMMLCVRVLAVFIVISSSILFVVAFSVAVVVIVCVRCVVLVWLIVYVAFVFHICLRACCCAMHICEYDATVLRAVVFAGAYMCSCV